MLLKKAALRRFILPAVLRELLLTGCVLPIFEGTRLFFGIFQILQYFPNRILDFCDFSGPSYNFCNIQRILAKFHARYQAFAKFRKIFIDFHHMIFGNSLWNFQNIF